jgi:uncharacterized protein YbjT (DUF2867 family)
LIEDQSVESITCIVRREVNFDHHKVRVKVIDFQDLEVYEDAIEPQSSIFCAIGTTNKKVKGNKEKYRSVDYHIPVKAAKFGLKKGCKTFVLVSSMGADSKSSNFYTRLKGEVEDEISNLGFDNLHIFRPSLLLGDRSEFRLGERIGQILMNAISFLLPSKIKPIHAKQVAKAMVMASKQSLKDSNKIYFYKDIKELCEK